MSAIGQSQFPNTCLTRMPAGPVPYHVPSLREYDQSPIGPGTHDDPSPLSFLSSVLTTSQPDEYRGALFSFREPSNPRCKYGLLLEGDLN